MKTLFLAAFATFALGAGSAFAEGGDGWDMAHMLSRGPVGFEMVKPQAAVTPDAAIVAHSETTTRDANGAMVGQKVGEPKPATFGIANPALSYPLTWGNG
jgi:hypothetical protein